jgi:hypothetical protein
VEIALALSLIGALTVLALGTSAWSVVLHLRRREQPDVAELVRIINATRLELSDLTEKFIAGQKRAAVRAMRDRREEADAAPAELTPLELKAALRRRAFGGLPPNLTTKE